MDLALNNLQRVMGHKNQPTKKLVHIMILNDFLKSILNCTICFLF